MGYTTVYANQSVFYCHSGSSNYPLPSGNPAFFQPVFACNFKKLIDGK